MYEFRHSTSRADCTFFDARLGSQTEKKARLPTQSVQASECRSDLHDSCTNTQPCPEKSVCSLSVILARQWALQVVRQVGRSVGSHEISYCFLLLLCSLLLRCPCFADCCHDPFIVRSASNLSTFPWFHSVCASVSIFTINFDNCLFLFLCKCLRACIGSLCTYRGCSLSPDPS